MSNFSVLSVPFYGNFVHHSYSEAIRSCHQIKISIKNTSGRRLETTKYPLWRNSGYDFESAISGHKSAKVGYKIQD